MHVKAGTIYGFLGKNGAEKTTVFKMLAGILNATAGSVKICGLDITLQRTEVLKQIGTLIETPVFYEHLSAAENLKLHLAYMGGAGLDPAGIKEMRELFSNLVQQNHLTILLSSHILSEIEQVADTIGFITNGKLIEKTSLSKLQERYPSGLEKYFMEKQKEC